MSERERERGSCIQKVSLMSDKALSALSFEFKAFTKGKLPLKKNRTITKFVDYFPTSLHKRALVSQ